jgi:hypothetical protein
MVQLFRWRQVLHAFVLLLLIGTCGSALAECAVGPYFPIQTGLLWEAEVQGQRNMTQTSRMENVSDNGFDLISEVSGTTETTHYDCQPDGITSEFKINGFTVTSADTTGVTLPNADRWQVGNTWTQRIEFEAIINNGSGLKVSGVAMAQHRFDVIEAISTPLGNFEAMRLTTETNISLMTSSRTAVLPPIVLTAWYAPGIGLLRVTAANFSYEVTKFNGDVGVAGAFKALTRTINLNGNSYSLEYSASEPVADEVFYSPAIEPALRSSGVQAVRVRANGNEIADPDEQVRIYSLFQTIPFLTGEREHIYCSVDGLNAEVDNTLVSLLNPTQAISNYLTQVTASLYETADLQLIEAFRSIVVPRHMTEEYGQFLEDFEAGIANSPSLSNATNDVSLQLVRLVDSLVKLGQYSNNRPARAASKQIIELLETPSIKNLRFGTEALIKLIKVSFPIFLQDEMTQVRADWLETVVRTSLLPTDQAQAAMVVVEEVRSQATSFDAMVAFLTEVGISVLGEQLSDEIIASAAMFSFKQFGTRIVGHRLAGILPAISLGYFLSDILLGSDAVFDNYKLSSKLLEIHESVARMRATLQFDARRDQVDGSVLSNFQAIAMIEELSAARAHQYYIDGNEAAYRNGLNDVIARFFQGRQSWSEIKPVLQKQADACEASAIEDIGYPKSVRTLVGLNSNANK